jgi:hypothetical protein
MGYLFAIAVITYLGLSLLLFHLGKRKKIGGRNLALISLLATPVVGFLVYLFSGNRMIVLEVRYVCPKCKYEYTHQIDFCPNCSTEEEKIRLIPEKRNMV